MMIEKHISALLYRYQCVIVPGFGAFLTETKPASIDIDTHTFYPPKKHLSFNANLKNNDGLLANHIALQEKISYGQAVNDIENMVSLWLNQLQSDERLILKNIGDIAYNSENSLVFYPNTPVNYLTDSFGLGSFTSPTVKREELKAQVEELEEQAPVLFTPERRKNYSYLKYAAVFVSALFIGSAGFKIYYDKKVTEETLIVEQAVQQKVQNKLQQATFFIDNPLPAVKLTVKEDVDNLYYHIVASAFRYEANAENAMQELKRQGFNSRKLNRNPYGLYPVLYGSYPTYESAHENLREIRKKHNKEAWILVKDL